MNIFRYKNFSIPTSTTPVKDYMAMGNLLAKTPLRKKSDGTFDDEDYYSESDEIVYCGEESLDLVNTSAFCQVKHFSRKLIRKKINHYHH